MLRAPCLNLFHQVGRVFAPSEFAYNNGYQKSLEMAPFEARMGGGAEHLRTGRTRRASHLRARFGNTSRRASEVYTGEPKKGTVKAKKLLDRRRRPLVFKEGDHVYLRVSPMKGVHRFGVKGKLAPRYVGPFKISEKCGPVAYRLELPPRLAAVHDIFHVASRVPEEEIDTSQVQIEPDLTYEARPVKVLDRKQRSTRRSTVTMYKVQWSEHTEEEATWETEEYLRTKYPGFLPSTSN
ncbi:hypothetical protein U9M48_014431, partial [Paspalum notatum var. saurae]